MRVSRCANVCVRTCACLHVFVRMHMRVCFNIYVCLCSYSLVCLCMYECMCVCMSMCMHVCMCACMCACTYSYAVHMWMCSRLPKLFIDTDGRVSAHHNLLEHGGIILRNIPPGIYVSGNRVMTAPRGCECRSLCPRECMIGISFVGAKYCRKKKARAI